MADAVDRLWSHPALTVPWSDRASFLGPLEPFCALTMYGLITVNDTMVMGCQSNVIPDMMNDFLYLDIPFRMIQQAAPVRLPFTPEQNPWIPAFEKALAMVGAYVYAQHPFDEARIGGWGGWMYRERPGGTLLSEREVLEQGGFLLSPKRWQQLSPEAPAVVLESGLRWVPRRQYRYP